VCVCVCVCVYVCVCVCVCVCLSTRTQLHVRAFMFISIHSYQCMSECTCTCEGVLSLTSNPSPPSVFSFLSPASFRKRTNNHRALLREMTHKNTVSLLFCPLSLSAKEPIIIGLFCRKWHIKIRYLLSPVPCLFQIHMVPYFDVSISAKETYT